MPIKYTLIADGSSDKSLLNIINWLLNDLYPELPSSGSYADFRVLSNPPANSDIRSRINYAEIMYPFDILFYHRDAETGDKDIIATRQNEIHSRVAYQHKQKVVCIIPIRMMEAWLLIDENAIKKAAGNRGYSKNISLPSIRRIESISDPKLILHELLKTTSGLKGRNLDKFNANYATHLVAEYITDFGPLRNLSSFMEFENNLKRAVDQFIGL
jgi:hypothetical protein